MNTTSAYAAKMRTPLCSSRHPHGARNGDRHRIPAEDHAGAGPDRRTRRARDAPVERYLDDPDFRFTLPLAPAGTPFRRRCATRSRDSGRRSRTYGELARATPHGAARGRRRLRRQPHRRRHSLPSRRRHHGSLGGFMGPSEGDPLAIKRWLLRARGLPLRRVTRASRAMVTSPTGPQLIDAFCDQLWLQDGLAPSSLASYRRDLLGMGAWLEPARRYAARCAAPRRRSVPRRSVPREGEGDVDRPATFVAAAILRTAAAAGHAVGRSDAARARAEAAAAAAEEPDGDAGRGAARLARHRHDARPARPRDAGDALCDGPARLRTRRPQARAGLARHGRRARARQGQQGAPRAARRGGDRLAQALPRRPPAPNSPATARATRSSSPRGAAR